MNSREIEYYRAVEDHFALLRGTPFLFSPKDFSLLNRWWNEGVPLAAVLAGLGEVFERRRESSGDPISSLSYCRHAVARHAKRLATARVGEVPAGDGQDASVRLATLAASVRRCAEAYGADEGTTGVLAGLASAIESMPPAATAASLDEALSRLEATALDSLLEAVPRAMLVELDHAVEEELSGIDLGEDVRGRTRRTLRRRALRRALGLPRLEL